MELVLQPKDSFDFDGFCQMSIVMSETLVESLVLGGSAHVSDEFQQGQPNCWDRWQNEKSVATGASSNGVYEKRYVDAT